MKKAVWADQYIIYYLLCDKNIVYNSLQTFDRRGLLVW